MSVKHNFRKLLLVTTSCAFFAACADTSISSPGAENPGTPPGDGGNPPPAGQTIDLIPAGGCGTGSIRETSVTNGDITINACEITGNITTNTTIAPNAGVIITGPTFVGTDDGATGGSGARATLSIGAGATLFGAAGSDYIVVTRGSRIEAQGTADAPVIFTSRTDVEGSVGENDKGLWGGLVLNGRAPINACTDATAVGGSADCEKSGEGSSGLFGGADAADSSGILNYVQVRFAGFKVNNEDELNGIAFQGVGSGTQVDYVQVHNNSDDGVEMFGGTVDLRHLVLTGNDDDSMDYTDGWRGRAQFVLVRQGPSGDQGFEFDNRGGNDTANNLEPRSNPMISNFTLIGNRNGSGSNDSDQGMLIREGTAGRLYNGIVADFGDDCIDIDQDATFARIGAATDPLDIQSVVLDCVNNFDESTGDPVDLSDWFLSRPNNAVINNTLNGVFSGPAEQAVTAFDVNGADSWFEDVDYIGAFADDEIAASNWASGWTYNLFEDAGCPEGTTESAETINGARVCQITGNITSDLRLTRGNMYELIGPVFVGVDRGPDPASPLPSGIEATLTVDPGVTVFGSAGSDYIVVTRGSQLRSNGTASSPVIFTARTDIEGTAGVNTKGQWGGLVLNGRAPINACTDATATGGTVDCEKSGEGSSGLFGGATADDTSGSITYTQVRFAGFKVNNEDELNGIAFQGVGSGTFVDYVQVHNNSDDGVEMFGGAVDLRHLVLTGNDDDSMDYTDGWRGRAQYVIVVQGASGDQGFEFDNRGGNDTANNLTPRSNPMISNFTLIGNRNGSGSNDSDQGMLIREGTAGQLYNGLVVNFGDDCIDVDQQATFDRIGAASDFLDIQSVALDCVNNFDESAGETPAGFANLEAWFLSRPNNTEYTNSLTGFAFFSGGTGVVPGSAETALISTDVNALDTWFEPAGYVGAVEDASDTWYQGWTFVPAQQ
ncbi:hypothetical protein [Maricaulis sp.]|uniref:hypothetical protein n=1 Tax=Maricaulis sp. TaxID=1486257 RepID=UPI001B0F1C47|nr:hypothetical protein [Maricaulis sp.]MBO6766417.1 hypothetical protein [Maricaulis sp.]